MDRSHLHTAAPEENVIHQLTDCLGRAYCNHGARSQDYVCGYCHVIRQNGRPLELKAP